MNDSNLLIHIGYPKTASTWLQSDIFLDNNTGFSVPWPHQDGLCEKATDLFITNTNFSHTEVQKFFMPGINNALENGLFPVLSNEFLSACFFYTPKNYHLFFPQEIAERLKLTFPNAKVLIMIREQKSMLLSAYKQMLIMRHTLGIEKFINVGDKDIVTHPSIGNLENLKFDILIEKYQSLFGKDNVLVLPLEKLKKDEHIFWQSLYKFLDLPFKKINITSTKNVALKGSRLVVLRELNKLTLRNKPESVPKKILKINHKTAQILDNFIPQKFSKSIETNWKEFIKTTVGDYYQESNKRTSMLTNNNLVDLGYD